MNDGLIINPSLICMLNIVEHIIHHWPVVDQGWVKRWAENHSDAGKWGVHLSRLPTVHQWGNANR